MNGKYEMNYINISGEWHETENLTWFVHIKTVGKKRMEIESVDVLVYFKRFFLLFKCNSFSLNRSIEEYKER